MNRNNMKRVVCARYKIIRFGAFLIMLTLAACGSRISQQEDSADVTVRLTAESTQIGQTTLRITVKDDKGEPVDDATLNVKGEMTHAGMPPVLAEEIRDSEDGIYAVPFEWTMSGDWIVTVDVTLKDGRTASRQFDLSVTGQMDMQDTGNE